jgi:hypothetical protein
MKCERFLSLPQIHTDRSSSQMADIAVDVVLKKAQLLKRDRKIGSFLVNAAQLASEGQEGIFGVYLLS